MTVTDVNLVMRIVERHTMLPLTIQHSEWHRDVAEPIQVIVLQRLVLNLSARS